MKRDAYVNFLMSQVMKESKGLANPTIARALIEKKIDALELKDAEVRRPAEGEWVEPPDSYFMGCCDCGSIHRMEFRVREGKAQFRAWRVAHESAAPEKK